MTKSAVNWTCECDGCDPAAGTQALPAGQPPCRHGCSLASGGGGLLAVLNKASAAASLPSLLPFPPLLELCSFGVMVAGDEEMAGKEAGSVSSGHRSGVPHPGSGVIKAHATGGAGDAEADRGPAVGGSGPSLLQEAAPARLLARPAQQRRATATGGE